MTAGQPQYKDRLFSFIFGSEEHREWTLSLYNAVNGSSYTEPDAIEITTIRQVLYLGMHNDVSFLISGEMNMYEQQSTYNPNIPLRMLQYAGNLYERDLTERGKNKYSRKLVELPVPKLVVFYNGREEEPDEQTLRLSDAFAVKKRTEADIEVRVRMVNINAGRSPDIMSACKPLAEYAWVVEQIRAYEREYELDIAIDKAITEMPAEYELKSYLEAHRAEVKSMLLTEYDEARAMDLFRQEGLEEGLAKGEKLGLAKGETRLKTLFSLLIAMGRADEIGRAINDEDYLRALYEEFGIA